MVRFIILSNARAGSCFFTSLLRSSSHVGVTKELLNDENEESYKDPIGYIERNVVEKEATKKFVGIRIFPEQLFFHNLNFDHFVRSLGAKIVLVLWRENTTETFVSRLIAQKTMCWFAKKPTTVTESVYVPAEQLESYLSERLEEWRQIGAQWPVDIEPIFVKYEDLASDPVTVMKAVYGRLSMEEDFEPLIYSYRQNPAPLKDKLTNWNELPDGLRNASINVPDILMDAINRSLCVPAHSLHVVPDREPPAPPGGWFYKVSEPYTPNEAKTNVLDALDANSVSSGGCWPAKMAAKLRALFGCPVAQPCCNGFSAIFLALQVCDIGPDDEVVIPSLTMVAVSNAVKMLNAIPVFADSLPDNYNPGLKEFSYAITQKTKAIIITHTYGVPTPDLEKLLNLCREKSIFLIEDISECLGVTVNSGAERAPRLLGTFGDLACASMYANKLVHAGDGGFVLAKDPKLHARLVSLVNHGFTPSYHFLHFDLAINAKINGLGAALACGTLDCLRDVMERRKEISTFYRSALKQTPLKFASSYGAEDTPWVFGAECENKDQRRELREFLAKHGIETRNFFFPLHLQPVNTGQSQQKDVKNSSSIIKAPHQESDKLSDSEESSAFPNAECLAIHGFYLPTHQQLSDADLQFICNVISAFYEGTRDIIGKPPEKPVEYFLRIKPGTYEMETVTFVRSGTLKIQTMGRTMHSQVMNLCLNAKRQLIFERWDCREDIRNQLRERLQRAQHQGVKSVEDQLKPYLEYFDSQADFEPHTIQPWLNENLSDPIYDEANEIETTTEVETKQILCYLIDQLKPKNILELGCLFGHTTMLMASKAISIHEVNEELPKIYACDTFRWHTWMDFFLTKSRFTFGQSFFNYFCSKTAKFSEIIKPIQWSLLTANKPQILHDVKAELVFLDFTQEADELERVYQVLKPNFIPDKTVIVVNGITPTSIQFFTRNRPELTPIAQCTGTLSKTFLFGRKEESKIMLKTLNFQSTPDWQHHHRNAFNSAIEALKNEMHDSTSSVIFVPSVESWLCDNQELKRNLKFGPWIGIVHEIVHNAEQFYVPDLQRLCYIDRYRQALATCRGLLTLTSLQAEYLNQHWPVDLPRIPIQVVTYPLIDPPDIESPRNILELFGNGKIISLILIGSFARDFDMFFTAKIPANYRKVLLICDEKGRRASKRAPDDVTVLERLSDDEYEVLLRSCVVFLSLLQDGAANTIILECIARNVPVVCPNMRSCMDYLGEKYPLYFNDRKGKVLNMQSLLMKENIENAIQYLKNMDKAKFSISNFVSSIQDGPVILNVPLSMKEKGINFNPLPPFKQYDVTILICSYKRTHHLKDIIDRLWSKQDFEGTMEIFIWNNNEQRIEEVNRICEEYVKLATEKKRLDVIGSTRNHFAAVRMAMPALMQSETLLICDDDILPNSNYVSYFMNASKIYLDELICLRGHKFLPHNFDAQNPTKTWKGYKNVRFIDDYEPNQLLHFAHADACLIPRVLLRECASVEMPQADFALVDDYWMSFILSHKFNRRLRKISLSDCQEIPFTRADDSDTPGLALYTRPEVIDAKQRLYMHHMLQGWPQWAPKKEIPDAERMAKIKTYKTSFWEKNFAGINVSSWLSDEDFEDLAQLNIQYVRLGAVGHDDCKHGEFQTFLNDVEGELRRLVDLIKKFDEKRIFVVLSLPSNIATKALWGEIALALVEMENVIGYDLINEPFTEKDTQLHLSELAENCVDEGLDLLIEKYSGMIKAIREVDQATPIIIEPSFWGHCEALYKKSFDALLNADSNLIMSVHFYQPKLLTRRPFNRGRFSFPGVIPLYNCQSNPAIEWDKALIYKMLAQANDWSKSRGIKILLGEFGISRDIVGASAYLQAIFQSCAELAMPCFLFSYRDPRWEAMNYELGTDVDAGLIGIPLDQNPLMRMILNEMSRVNCH